MSVLRNPFPVMKTLIAPTLTVLTAVLVNKDSLEMEHFVKVSRVFIQQLSNPLAVDMTQRSMPFFFHFLNVDFDECSVDFSPCDENADCTNSDGSYSCTCKQGFTGNGAVCEDIVIGC